MIWDQNKNFMIYWKQLKMEIELDTSIIFEEKLIANREMNRGLDKLIFLIIVIKL